MAALIEGTNGATFSTTKSATKSNDAVIDDTFNATLSATESKLKREIERLTTELNRANTQLSVKPMLDDVYEGRTEAQKQAIKLVLQGIERAERGKALAHHMNRLETWAKACA